MNCSRSYSQKICIVDLTAIYANYEEGIIKRKRSWNFVSHKLFKLNFMAN